MDAVWIVLLAVVVALLAGALAWFGPRRRHWRTHATRKDATDDDGKGSGRSDQEG